MIDIKRNSYNNKEESIDKMLSRYKRKHRQLRITQEQRNRKHYVKPSVERREEIQKAAYKLKKYGK
jgi:small subunit ribosomal protein S21